MEKTKFHVEDWFERYPHRLNGKSLERGFSAFDGVSVRDFELRKDGKINVILELKIDTDAIVKINNKDVNVNVSFYGSNNVDYKIETNLSSEDSAQAEQNLNDAIKSGRTVFKVPTVAILDDEPWPSIYQPAIRTRDGNLLIEMTDALELFTAAMKGEETELGDFSFIKEFVPAPKKDERIEIICEIPEELMMNAGKSSKQKFHLEDWMNYYKARLDKDDLNDKIYDLYEGYSNAKIEVSGDTITTHVEAGLALDLDMFFEDVETGEEIETEEYTVADYEYTVVYKLDDLDSDDIEEIEEALNAALNEEESTFEIIVPATVIEVRDVNITDVEQCDVDDEILERIGSESAVLGALQKSVTQELSELKDARHNGDFIQPPQDKDVKFICTIPAE